MDVLKQRRTFVMDRLATTIKLLFLALTCPPGLCKFSLTQGFLWVPKDLAQELESVCWYNHMWVLLALLFFSFPLLLFSILHSQHPLKVPHSYHCWKDLSYILRVHAQSTLPRFQICWPQNSAEWKWLESLFPSELESSLKAPTGTKCPATPPLPSSLPTCWLSQGLLAKCHHHPLRKNQKPSWNSTSCK